MTQNVGALPCDWVRPGATTMPPLAAQRNTASSRVCGNMSESRTTRETTRCVRSDPSGVQKGGQTTSVRRSAKNRAASDPAIPPAGRPLVRATRTCPAVAGPFSASEIAQPTDQQDKTCEDPLHGCLGRPEIVSNPGPGHNKSVRRAENKSDFIVCLSFCVKLFVSLFCLSSCLSVCS
jgi:hypothetical protein